MLEERVDELRVSFAQYEQFANLWSKLFVLLKRASCDASVLDVARCQFSRIGGRCETGQQARSQFSLGIFDAFLGDGFLMLRQSVDDQMNRLATIEHQFSGWCREQLASESSFERCKSEGTFRADVTGSTHTLPPARPDAQQEVFDRTARRVFHVSSLPGSPIHPRRRHRIFLASLSGNGWIRVVLPVLDCFRVALVSTKLRCPGSRTRARPRPEVKPTPTSAADSCH